MLAADQMALPKTLEDRIDDHDAQIAELRDRMNSIDISVSGITLKMTDMHAENRIRSEHLERMFVDGLNKLTAAVQRLGSVRGWIGWAIVTASSAGVAAVIAHFSVHS